MAKARCRATNRSGKRCANSPAPGAVVCRFHGGRAPQVIAAAGRRLMAQAATEGLARLGVAIETTPVEALEAMLAEAGGNVCVLRSLVADLGSPYVSLFHANGEPTGRALPHVLVSMYDRERDRLGALSLACAGLGIDDRRLRLAETDTARLYGAVRSALVAAGVDGAQRESFTLALAGALRAAA